MNMSVRMSQTGLFRHGNKNMQNMYGSAQKTAPASNGIKNGAKTAQNANSVRRMLNGTAQKEQQGSFAGSIADNSFSYADSIRASRMKAKDTSLKLKKLRYDFKSISSKILQSKTSASARQVVGMARREIMRLKRQRQNGEYDEEELQSAISHAQAMERVAKKKLRHLEEEEMVKVTGGPCSGELEEKEDPESEAVTDDAQEEQAEQAPADDVTAVAEDSADKAAEAQAQANQELSEIRQEELREMMQAQMEELREMMQAQMEELQRAMEQQTEELQMENAASMESFAGGSMDDMMSAMMDEMSEAMREMLDEMGLSDLADSTFATAETEMDPADYKMMKIKHRSEEMKAIAKADAEYLKAVFDKLEKMKGAGMGSLPGAGNSQPLSGGVSVGGAIAVSGGGSAPAPAIDVVSAPGDSAGAMPDAGGFDISV